MLISIALLSCAALQAAAGTPPVAAEAGRTPGRSRVDERQVLWQRSLDDALAIQAQEHRPILIAVNMDGESASERIVRERYRDPAWVASTRRFVCLTASAFRHSARDSDEQGRRIPCPRLGEVTCGEHIALEPLLFDKYLGGERIAPRHALILESGEKVFDLTLLFDLREVDRALEGAQHLAPPAAEDTEPAALGPAPSAASLVEALGRARTNRERSVVEGALAAANREVCEAAIGALSTRADPGSLPYLRVLYVRSSSFGPGFASRITDVALARSLAKETAILVRELATDPIELPGSVGLGPRAHWLEALGRLDGAQASHRSLLLSFLAAGTAEERTAAEAGLRMTPAELRALESGAAQAAQVLGSSVPRDTQAFLDEARRVKVRVQAPRADELGSAEDLERALAELEPQLREHPEDSLLQERWGRASLDLARRRIESNGADIELLLGDAEQFLARASAARPKAPELLLLRARTAYHLGRFDQQEKLALEAFRALQTSEPSRPGGHAADGPAPVEKNPVPGSAPDARALEWPFETLEALRWLADACARQLLERSGRDARIELGGQVTGVVAASLAALPSNAEDGDWASLASFFAALGRRREELAFAQSGLERFPESGALRNVLNTALWSQGLVDVAVAKAAWFAREHPQSAACSWYLGYALVQQGDSARRAEAPDSAIASYARAGEAFQRSVELEPEFKPSATHYLALCALGRGFANLLADRRDRAAECLVEGIRALPAIASVRDGLDREAIDLLDGSLEWRESGDSPTEVARLLEGLFSADPYNPFWPDAVSDSELREALRADGRGDPERGDRHLGLSISAARRAMEMSSEEPQRRQLAQSATVCAERLLRRGRVDEARAFLGEASSALQDPGNVEALSEPQLVELAARLRAQLGEARPRSRPGR
jgi:tetratricopeptide (TPR) repeat protein